ncbi:Putative F-box protein PP2-B12 [Striga hermonthica]|uniref:F-box protein PP2-B12 n=1 Tax=Striga hermonthica TaxID=68872 RepID=A0A9N7MUR8_STRHE|nr:Putative F-box protein PP2-B12 [Striga hermonthica]
MAVESFGDIHALPEDCIANALSLTSPKDACRLSAVASTFRSASQSDVVWGRFLPSDYRDLISGAVDGPDALLSKFRSKKDLYLHLCDHPILIDGGRKGDLIFGGEWLVAVRGGVGQLKYGSNIHKHEIEGGVGRVVASAMLGSGSGLEF